jgi:hypothetical protein
MQLTHALPRTRILPAMQAFRCDPCCETLIWKGADPSRAQQSPGPAVLRGNRWMTRYVALSFRKAGKDFVPGPALECPDAGLAIQRAELMMREGEIAGAIAFSRRGNLESGEAEDAVVLKVFGAIPEDFDMA